MKKNRSFDNYTQRVFNQQKGMKAQNIASQMRDNKTADVRFDLYVSPANQGSTKHYKIAARLILENSTWKIDAWREQ